MTSPTKSSWHAVFASFLGWTLDAFDFFVVVFMFDTLAKHFGVDKKDIIFTTTATLALRPVGAVIFGLLADRYGRRIPLIANVLFFSLIELLCGFAPSYTVFLILRALYGIGMGGEWGVGASLAMEQAPPRWRGLLSGILQSGYSIGYILAAIASRLILPHFSFDMGWRVMFWVGGLPALLALYIRSSVPESEAWKQHRVADMKELLRTLGNHIPMMLSLMLMMTLFMFFSHGTQDLYPDFLKTVHRFSQATVSNLAIFYNIGAVVGAMIFGMLSQRRGRRFAIVCAVALALLAIPVWAFGPTLLTLAAGAFIMQMGVQGAWGVIPAHLNELSPDSVRGLVPGLAYQLGILFASGTNSIEYALQHRFGYQWALAGFETTVIVLLAIVVMFGREQHGKEFVVSE